MYELRLCTCRTVTDAIAPVDLPRDAIDNWKTSARGRIQRESKRQMRMSNDIW
jgi:hypothetical protein